MELILKVKPSWQANRGKTVVATHKAPGGKMLLYKGICWTGLDMIDKRCTNYRRIHPLPYLNNWS